jgi:hypothetical protein
MRIDLGPHLQGCIREEAQERRRDGQAYEFPSVGQNIDDDAIHRCTHRAALQLSAGPLQLGGRHVSSGLGFPHILLARSRAQQREPRFRLPELSGRNSCIAQRLQDSRSRNADALAQGLGPLVGLLGFFRACIRVADDSFRYRNFLPARAMANPIQNGLCCLQLRSAHLLFRFERGAAQGGRDIARVHPAALVHQDLADHSARRSPDRHDSGGVLDATRRR